MDTSVWWSGDLFTAIRTTLGADRSREHMQAHAKGDTVTHSGHVAFQSQRGDVHTVLVDGRIVKRDHRLVGVDLAAARAKVEATVEHLRATLGEEAWEKGMNPDVPETALEENPYTYSDYRSSTNHGEALD